MKFLLSFFISCFFIVSCAPEFEFNTRILVKGNLQDENGAPLVDKNIRVYTRNFPGFLVDNQTQYVLGENKSSVDGSFEVTSLFEIDDKFYIAIDGDDTHINYLYQTSTETYRPNNLTFDLGTIVLKKKAIFNFSISRVSATGTTLNYSISFQSPNCMEIFEEGILVPELSNCYTDSIRNGTLDETNPDATIQLNTTLNSIITFAYSINNEPMITESITVDQPNFTYAFTY